MEMEFTRRHALEKLEQRLGYRFSQIGLLDVALTHTSFVKGDGNAKEHNERLEYLGDAVLELCVSEYLYRNYPKMNEGSMTRARALTVCEEALQGAARGLELGECLLLSHGEEHSGGRQKPSILADAMEAVIGAVFLDGGAEPAFALVLRLTTESIHQAVAGLKTKDYKTMLQELVQKQRNGAVSYELVFADGPDHKKTFTMRAIVDGKPMGQGNGASKQEAGQQAAKATLEMIEQT